MATDPNDLSSFPEARMLLPNPLRSKVTQDNIFTTPEMRQVISARYGAGFLILAINVVEIIVRHKDTPDGNEWSLPNVFPPKLDPLQAAPPGRPTQQQMGEMVRLSASEAQQEARKRSQSGD
jgi:hypothetical protein